MKQAEKDEIIGPPKKFISAHQDTIGRILMMSLDTWDQAWMNRQSLAAALSHYTHVIHVGQPKYPTRLRDLFSWPKRRILDGVPNWILPGWMNTNFEDAHRHRWFARRIKRRIFRFRSHRSFQALMLWHPSLVSYLDATPADVTCCYIDDFIEGLAVNEEHRIRLREQQALLFDKVDVIFVTWKGLAEKLGLADKAIILPHGMNFEYYSRASRNELPTPPDIPLGRPIVGHSGSIKTKHNFELLEKMSHRLSNWNIVLIGHDCVEETKLRQRFDDLLNRPNVFHLGLKAYHELGSYLQAFDVCMMCYALDDYSRYCLPLKMFEYFATGKPIVSTYLPSLEDYRDFITICTNHDDFITAVAQQGSLDTPERRQARIAFASRNTWKDRAQTILQVLAASIRKKQNSVSA